MVLWTTVAATLLLYFSLTLYIFPQSYQIGPLRPEAVVTDVGLSESEIMLGQSLVVSVAGANRGENADMQIVSIGLPNLTRTDSVKVVQHNFTQTPDLISASEEIGSAYSGLAVPVEAQYAIVEAFSRPWEGGSSYSIELQINPETEGRFAIFIKSVAFPHSWNSAHWPAEGIVDPQQEFVQVYYVHVTKP